MELDAAREGRSAKLTPFNLKIVPIKPDGNCLFRAVAHQLFRDENRHAEVRSACAEHLASNSAFYAEFVPGRDVTAYVAQVSRPGEWGDHIELQALSDLYNAQIEIYCTEETPTVIYAVEGKPRRTLRLFYNNMVHYDSITELQPGPAAKDSLAALLKQQRERLERKNALIRRRNLAASKGLTLRQILDRSLAQVEKDFAQQAKSAAAESEKAHIEEEIVAQVLRESAPQKLFDLFSALISMGYSDNVAFECVMNFGPHESDLAKVVNFIAMSQAM